MEITVSDGVWVSKLDLRIMRTPYPHRRSILDVNLSLWKGRFVKTYTNSIVMEEGAMYPWEQIMGIFEHARQPNRLQQFARECENDEMRREGYYRAMDHIHTASNY